MQVQFSCIEKLGYASGLSPVTSCNHEKLSPENQVRSFMTNNGWCRSNYHKNGKRRFGQLANGFCNECSILSVMQVQSKDADKITRLEGKISDLEEKRDQLNSEIKGLRFKLASLIKSREKSGEQNHEN